MGAHALGCLIGLVVLLACLEHIVDVVQPALACSLLFDSLGESEVAVDPSLEMAFRSDDDIEVFPVLVNEDVAKAAEGLIVPEVGATARPRPPGPSTRTRAMSAAPSPVTRACTWTSCPRSG